MVRLSPNGTLVKTNNFWNLIFVTGHQVKEIEIAVDEKELQKEAALKEKEKELQALRVQLESLSQDLQERSSEASRTGQEQATKVSNLLAELQKVSVEKKGKCSKQIVSLRLVCVWSAEITILQHRPGWVFSEEIIIEAGIYYMQFVHRACILSWVRRDSKQKYCIDHNRFKKARTQEKQLVPKQWTMNFYEQTTRHTSHS